MRSDPARQALAAAIAAASVAEAAHERARTVLARAEGFVEQAGVRRVEAEEALSKVLAEQGDNLASAIASGSSTDVGGAVRTARARLIDCEDELEAAKAALVKLRDAVQEPEENAA